MWVLYCPVRKNGTPVLGAFGSTLAPMVILPLATWKQLCEDVPQLKTTQFQVGSDVDVE